MASSKLITFYISQIVIPIKDQFNYDAIQADLDADWTNEMVDTFLKHHFDLDKSKIEMTTEELQELIEWSIVFGQGIGLELSYPKDELDDMLDFKDLK